MKKTINSVDDLRDLVLEFKKTAAFSPLGHVLGKAEKEYKKGKLNKMVKNLAKFGPAAAGASNVITPFKKVVTDPSYYHTQPGTSFKD